MVEERCLLGCFHGGNNDEWQCYGVKSQTTFVIIIVRVYKNGDKGVVIIVDHHCYQLPTKSYPISTSKG
jgi:hypothetical protein